mmetsp:Transcript_30719/g.73231  ORF Transcript_30719/g.73231 Transcript_30719/m.73231 type:complete len:201 (+) Transcript_30719:169-771(+)
MNSAIAACLWHSFSLLSHDAKLLLDEMHLSSVVDEKPLQLPCHKQQVCSSCRAIQPQRTMQELFEGNGPAAVCVQHLQQVLRFGCIHVNGVKEVSNSCCCCLVSNLIKRNEARAIGVNLIKHPPRLKNLSADLDVPRLTRYGLDKGSSNHIHEGQVAKGHEENKNEPKARRHILQQRTGNIVPINSSTQGLENREHANGD